MRKSLKSETLHHILLENMKEKSSQAYQKRSLAMTVAENGFESEFLAEGVVKNISKDILQFLIAGAAEYGLTAATLGGAASGPAEASAVIIDALFAIDEVKTTIETVGDLSANAPDFFKEAMEAGKVGMGNLEDLYPKIKLIIQKGVTALSAESSIDEVADSIKEKVGALINKFVNAVIAGIKTLIPDAVIGLAVSTAMRAAIAALSDNAFTLFKFAVNKAGKLASFITDPKVAPKFFEDALKELSEMCTGMKKYIKEDLSWWKVAAATTVTMGAAAAPLVLLKSPAGPAALDKAKEIIDEQSPKIVKLIETLVSTIMPGIAVALAIYQIMMKSEYKKETTVASNEKKTTEEPAKPPPNEEKKTTERYLHLGTLMSEYSYKRNKERNILLYEWAVTGKKIYKVY